MNRSYSIVIAVSILLASCQQAADEPSTLKYYGDAYEDIGYSIAALEDGYVFTGQLNDIEREEDRIISSNKNLGIIKTGLSGNVVWKLSAGGKFDDRGAKVIVTADGSAICVGTFTDDASVIPGNTDVYAVKVSAAGSIIWQHRYGGSGNQEGIDIVQTADGFMILGSADNERLPVSDSTGNQAGKSDIYLLRISNDGILKESFYYGYPGNDKGEALKMEPDGSFVILGTTDRSDPGQRGNNIIIVRLNAAGNAVESRIIGGTEDESAADLEILDDGYSIAGTIGEEENQRILITRLGWDIFDPPLTGFPVEIRANGFPSGAEAITLDQEGNFIIAGHCLVRGTSDMLIMEIDPEGNEIAGHCIIKGSTGNQYARDVITDNDGSVVVVGTNSLESNSLITFLKFRF